MKVRLITGSLAIVCLLAASQSPATTVAAPPLLPSVAGGSHYHLTAVRAQYATGPSRIANTVCHVTNTSLTESIELKEVFVLGAGGTGSIISMFQGLVGQVVPPLGSIDLSINNTIPGVTPQTVTNGPGVRQVAFLWTGTAGLMNLNATIETRLLSNSYTRAEFVEHGFEVQP